VSEQGDLHSLIGAYAAGALEAEENEAFVAHLAGCSQCAIEVRELLETTALLGVAAAEPAPPALRATVLAEVARTRQLPPVVASAADRAARARRPARRWGLTAAACLAVFSIGLGAYAWQLHGENSDLRRESERVAALAAAPDARTVSGNGGGGTAQVIMSRADNRMEFVSQGLARPPGGRTYQIWLIGPNGPRSAGTFTPSPDHPATRMFTGPGDATALAVTEEPGGGSAQPTTKPFLVMALPA